MLSNGYTIVVYTIKREVKKRMLKATKIRIYPSLEQREKLSQGFGCARWVWNEALRHKTDLFKEQEASISKNELIKRLPELKIEHEWLKETHSQVLQMAIGNLDTAFQNFFAKRARYPKFKTKHSKQSIQYPQSVKVDTDDSAVFLPKIGWVKARLHREIAGAIKTCTVSKSATGKYLVSILADDGEEAPAPLKHIGRVVGIDLGLTDLIITSDGEKSGNPRFLKRAEGNLRRKQRKLSQKKKGSANRARARRLVAKAHERVANARNDFQHKLSTAITDENQAVVVEDLAVRNMLKNHCLAKAIADAGWHGFTTKLGYKLARKGGYLKKIDRFFPSSKTCSACGVVKDSLPLTIRAWTCDCGTAHDRDINAAINVRNQGILSLKADGLTVSACGGSRNSDGLLPSVAA